MDKSISPRTVGAVIVAAVVVLGGLFYFSLNRRSVTTGPAEQAPAVPDTRPAPGIAGEQAPAAGPGGPAPGAPGSGR